MRTRIWLMRHGETESNRNRIFQGQIDAELNDAGLEQARHTARVLRPVPFSRIISSDLRRAGRTAEAIADGRPLAVEYDPDLREMHYGVLQGAVYERAAEVLEAYGMAEDWRAGRFRTEGLAPPGGESAHDLRDRCARFLERIHAEETGATPGEILLVAHGGQLRVLLTLLLGLPLDARHHFAFANCGISRVSVRGGHPQLDFHNLVVYEDVAGTPLPR